MASWNPSQLLELLRQYWGYHAFRPLQLEIIQSVLEGKDVLAILPTGGGKSLCYQLPTLAKQKLTVVVSPLIALMEDQVVQLQQRKIPATFLNSTLSAHEVRERMQGILEGNYLFLYCAPERFQSESFLQFLSQLDVGLFAIDEAHCISQWGHQFRPDYRKLYVLRNLFPSVPIIALTASAIPKVKEDIIVQLHLRQPNVFQNSVVRPNLHYQVITAENRLETTYHILESFRRRATILYVRSRKGTHLIAEHLKQKGFICEAYHAGLSASRRKQLQTAWINDELPVMVATNAFGMGIDKSDVRLVLHLDLPPDLESYYQEAGRAGRDGQPAFAILLYHPSQGTKAYQLWEMAYPPFHKVEYCYQWLFRYYQIPHGQRPLDFFPVELEKWVGTFRMPAPEILACLKILHEQHLIDLELEPDKHSCSVQVTITPEELREYAQATPQTIPVITALLREFGSLLYQFESSFDPHVVARKHNIPLHHLFSILNRMANDRVVVYRPPLGRESFRFLTPYHPLSPKALNWDYYQFLRDQAKERLTAMLRYVEDRDTCRQVLLASYFGETYPRPCGQCDNCLRKKSTPSLLSRWFKSFKF